jgi:epoxyqueuosine reductase
MEKAITQNHSGILTELAPDCAYRYRTMSVSHFSDLQAEIGSRKQSGKLSNNAVYRSYLNALNFELPPDFQEARSVIVMAVLTKVMHVYFHLNGEKHEILLPHYYDTGLTVSMLKNEALKNILPEAGPRLERTATVHLKLLAVRSGLGRYGRNNIFYADGLGSFVSLYALLTDHVFEEDNWHELSMLEQCENCSVCLKRCPTGAIRKDNFVIDVEKCITLYNELEGDLPEWIPDNAHNALMGCLLCQSSCPANHEAIRSIGYLDEITEDETRQFLSGNPDEAVMRSISKKLKLPYMPGAKDVYDTFRRNLSLLLPKAG